MIAFPGDALAGKPCRHIGRAVMFREHWCGLDQDLGDSTSCQAADVWMGLACSIMLNVLGTADGEEGLQAAHSLLSRAYQVPATSSISS